MVTSKEAPIVSLIIAFPWIHVLLFAYIFVLEKYDRSRLCLLYSIDRCVGAEIAQAV
jgi:hypothetical protein